MSPVSAKSAVQLIGRSPDIVALRQEIERVARSDAKVLITGESGTGKEIVAHAIHAHSPRAGSVFAPVNCAGLPLAEAQEKAGVLEAEIRKLAQPTALELRLTSAEP